MEHKIITEVKHLESEYETTPINIMEGLTFHQFKTLRMAEFYANSKYLSSPNYQGRNVDELERDTPFYNIINFRVTLAKTATDLDIKDFEINSDDPKHYVKAMLLRKEAYEWMKDNHFGRFLNEMGHTRPKYGGVITKKFEEKGELEMQVVEWKNVITDQINILDNPIIERHFMTFAELLKKKDVWDEDAIIEVLKRQQDKAIAKKYGAKEVSNRALVFEVKGEFPKEFLIDALNGLNDKDVEIKEEDKYEYTLQQYFIADVYGKSTLLFADDLKESPYGYLEWEKMSGRALGRGVSEDSEEAQVWTNDSVKNEKGAMDLAGKVVIKTSSKKTGSNILEVDNGKQIFIEKDAIFEVLNLTPSALGEFNNQIQMWRDQADGAVSSFDAITGEQPPAGTPYSQTALLNQIASKPFDYRREEAGIFLGEIFKKDIIPHLIKKLRKKHIFVTDYTDEELSMIDRDFQVSRANETYKKALLEGKTITQEEYNALLETEKLLGTKRYLEMPDNYFSDIIPKVSINTTGELKNKQAILQSLSTVLNDVIKSFNPNTGTFAVFDDPRLARIFGELVELSGAGISPASLMSTEQTKAIPQQPSPIETQQPAQLPVPTPA